MLIFSPTIANKRCPLYVFFNMRSKISFLFHFFLTNITLVDFITLARLAIRRQLVVKCGHLPGQSGCRPNAHLPHHVAAAGLARHARQRGQLRGQRLPRHLLRPGALLGVLGQHGEFLQGARARPRDVGAGGAGGGHGEHARVLRRGGGRTLLQPQPGMLHDPVQLDPVRGVLLQQPVDEVPHLGGQLQVAGHRVVSHHHPGQRAQWLIRGRVTTESGRIWLNYLNQ